MRCYEEDRCDDCPVDYPDETCDEYNKHEIAMIWIEKNKLEAIKLITLAKKGNMDLIKLILEAAREE